MGAASAQVDLSTARSLEGLTPDAGGASVEKLLEPTTLTVPSSSSHANIASGPTQAAEAVAAPAAPLPNVCHSIDSLPSTAAAQAPVAPQAPLPADRRSTESPPSIAVAQVIRELPRQPEPALSHGVFGKAQVDGLNPSLSKVFTETWEVAIDRSNGCMVGVDVDELGDGNLLVKSISQGNAVEAWNLAHPDRAIWPGDRIVAVNGRQESLIEECRKEQLLRIAVMRQASMTFMDDRPQRPNTQVVAEPEPESEQSNVASPASANPPPLQSVKPWSLRQGPGGWLEPQPIEGLHGDLGGCDRQEQRLHGGR